MSRSLATVILHYGSPSLARRLSGQLAAPGHDVRVLDNAAPEPFEGAWQRLPENLYWAGALAWAAETVRGEGFSHLFFLNNDVVFTSPPPHLPRLWQRLARVEKLLGAVGMYAPAVEQSPYHPQMVAAPDGECRAVEIMDGIALLLDLDALERIGGVDCADNPYGYGVDLWLSVRMRQAGLLLCVDQQVRVRHRYHTTAGAQDGFLARAAAAEESYMTARLGPDWRARVDALKQARTDIASLGGAR